MNDKKVVPIRPATDLIKVGGIIDASSASLCFYGKELNPEDISKALGIEPTTSFKKGYRRNEKTKPSTQGAWIYCIEGVAPLGPDDHIKNLLNQIDLSRDTWAVLCDKYQARISVGIHLYAWNRGFTLSPEVISLLVHIGMEIDFDIYADEDE